MMGILALAKQRYSVRQYADGKVEEEKLAKILEAGRVAPSAKNNQPVKLLVIREATGLEKLQKGARIYGAPLAIIVCGDKEAAWVRSYDGKNSVDIDAAIVTDHMLLQATELGLGTLWICHFDPAIIRQEFKLPDNLAPVNILCLGYAAGEAKSPERHDAARKPLSEIVIYESF